MELNSVRAEKISTMSPEDESDVKLRYYINISRNNESKSKLLQQQLVDAQITIRELREQKETVPFSSHDFNSGDFDSLGRPRLIPTEKNFVLDSNLDFETNRELLEPEQTNYDLFFDELPPISCDGYSVAEEFPQFVKKEGNFVESPERLSDGFLKGRPTSFVLSPLLTDETEEEMRLHENLYQQKLKLKEEFYNSSSAGDFEKFAEVIRDISEKRLSLSVDSMEKTREQLNNDTYRILFPDGFRPKRQNIFKRAFNWCVFKFEKLTEWKDDPRIQK